MKQGDWEQRDNTSRLQGRSQLLNRLRTSCADMERIDAGCSHLRSHPARSFAPASADAAHSNQALNQQRLTSHRRPHPRRRFGWCPWPHERHRSPLLHVDADTQDITSCAKNDCLTTAAQIATNRSDFLAVLNSTYFDTGALLDVVNSPSLSQSLPLPLGSRCSAGTDLADDLKLQSATKTVSPQNIQEHNRRKLAGYSVGIPRKDTRHTIKHLGCWAVPSFSHRFTMCLNRRGLVDRSPEQLELQPTRRIPRIAAALLSPSCP